MKLKLILVYTLVIALGLLGGMGTYAWFTSQASSTNNEFIAGTLSIEGDNTTEPVPLFKTEYDDEYYSQYDVGLWYPGKEVIGNNARNYTIENVRSLPAKIAGLSAEIKVFRKGETNYDPENMKSWSEDVKNSYDEFVGNLYIKVTNRGSEYFNGKLRNLTNGPQPLKRSTDNYMITLNPTKRADLKFEAYMSTEADNKAQGVSATVNIIIHATQDNDDAVNELLKVTP